MKNEIWKPIQGFEGFYEISDSGKVRNVRTGYTLRPWKIQGYWHIELYRDGESHAYLVHRLVAQAFIPNPENKPYVDHINGNRSNMKVSNLRWVTPLENAHNPITRKRTTEFHKRRIGITINNKPVLCVETGDVFKSALDAEQKLGIYHNQINKCCLKRPHYNTAGGLHWNYAQGM